MDGEQANDQMPQPTPSEPLPQAEASASSDPARPVSETAQTSATPVEQTAPAETRTAQIPANEPFDSAHDKPLPPTPDSFDGAHDKPTNAPAARTDSTSSPQGGRDLLVKARATIQNRKQKKLEKILEFLNTKSKITNDEVEKLLHVSDATATRYLSALKKQGAIKQVGKTGKAVVYTRI